MTNPAGLYDAAPAGPADAIARAFDQAAINGKDLRSGGAGPFSDYLAQTGSSVALGTAAQATGGLYADIVTGAGKVVDKNFDFTGIAADPRLKIDALLQTDTQGRPLFNDANGADGERRLDRRLPDRLLQGRVGRYWRAGDTTQVVTINGTPTGGTFVLSSGGNSATSPTTRPRRRCRPPCRRGAASTPPSPCRLGWWPLHVHVPDPGLQRGGRCGSVLGQPDRPDRRHGGHLAGDHRRDRRRRGRHQPARHRRRLVAGAYGVGMDISSASATRRPTTTARPGTPRSRRTSSCCSSRPTTASSSATRTPSSPTPRAPRRSDRTTSAASAGAPRTPIVKPSSRRHGGKPIEIGSRTTTLSTTWTTARLRSPDPWRTPRQTRISTGRSSSVATRGSVKPFASTGRTV
jgi:hypothetical protein